jgi:hypothetical protein
MTLGTVTIPRFSISTCVTDNMNGIKGRPKSSIKMNSNRNRAMTNFLKDKGEEEASLL